MVRRPAGLKEALRAHCLHSLQGLGWVSLRCPTPNLLELENAGQVWESLIREDAGTIPSDFPGLRLQSSCCNAPPSRLRAAEPWISAESTFWQAQGDPELSVCLRVLTSSQELPQNENKLVQEVG